MTDKELLKFAAMASEFEITRPVYDFQDFFLGFSFKGSSRTWNPLTNDGDALRLAMKLDMHIRFYRKHVDVDTEVRMGDILCEHFTSNKCAATRRAIVRAAAEIGKNMEKK